MSTASARGEMRGVVAWAAHDSGLVYSDQAQGITTVKADSTDIRTANAPFGYADTTISHKRQTAVARATLLNSSSDRDAFASTFSDIGAVNNPLGSPPDGFVQLDGLGVWDGAAVTLRFKIHVFGQMEADRTDPTYSVAEDATSEVFLRTNAAETYTIVNQLHDDGQPNYASRKSYDVMAAMDVPYTFGTSLLFTWQLETSASTGAPAELSGAYQSFAGAIGEWGGIDVIDPSTNQPLVLGQDFEMPPYEPPWQENGFSWFAPYGDAQLPEPACALVCLLLCAGLGRLRPPHHR